MLAWRGQRIGSGERKPAFFDLAKMSFRSLSHWALLVLVLSFPADSFAQTASAEEQSTIVFLGDSLTAGYGIDPRQAYPALIQGKIKDLGLDFQVINAGISGDTTAGGLARIQSLVQRRIDVLVLALGANDGLRGFPVKATQKNLEAIIEKVKNSYPSARIVIAGMLVPPNMGDEYASQFKAIFSAISQKTGASLIPFLLEDVAAIPQLNLRDRIHPNTEGHKIVAENVWRILSPILKQIDR